MPNVRSNPINWNKIYCEVGLKIELKFSSNVPGTSGLWQEVGEWDGKGRRDVGTTGLNEGRCLKW